MIKYSLECIKNHRFEAWFANSAAYEKQATAGQLCCPICSARRVKKALMAPNIVSGNREKSPAGPTSSEAVSSEALNALRKLKKFVQDNSEYVGPRFTKEALKIHHKETTPRNIYGEASDQDAKELHEQGVELYPIPLLPEDHN